MTPIEHYQQALTAPGFDHDPAQEQAVQHLQRLYDDLLDARGKRIDLRAGLACIFGRPRQPCRGLYLWGGVGRGKTWLVDGFCDSLPFERKMRIHFHRFMKRIHSELQLRKGEKNPLDLIAQQLASEAQVICLDEFFVSDITDAMLLAGLLEGLFQQGVTLVLTSNIVPDELYRDGLQRDKFLPAIALLNKHLEVINVDGGLDHRLRLLEQAELYHFPLSQKAEQALAGSFRQLTSALNSTTNVTQESGGIVIEGRTIPVINVSQDVVWFTFDALCNTPRSQNDYIELACEFHTVLISGVPQMGRESDDQARRFISLVDEFYDRSVKLIMSGAVALPELYTDGCLAFEFRRTLSRLQEMQSREYLGRHHVTPVSASSITSENVEMSWYVSGIDCPSCVKKVENALTRMDGVQKATLSFSTMRLQVTFAQGQSHVDDVQAVIARLGYQLIDENEGPAAVEEPSFLKKNMTLLMLAALMAFGFALSSVQPGISRIVLVVATLWGLFPVVKKALVQTRNGTPFGIETLMTIAALGALVLGETLEASMVLLLFLIGEQLEGLAANRARKGVESLMALNPDTAIRIVIASDGSERKETVMADRLNPGDLIEVVPGDRLAADAELLTLVASFDESALTGESVPVDRREGERVMAGSLCVDRVTRLRVVSEVGNNAIDRIIKLIESAEESKAPIERFIDRFSRWYTPLMLLIAALVVLIPPLLVGADWNVWIYRGLTLLLIACPCALVISTPAAVTSGLARAARQGILIKGGAVLEHLGRVRQVAFDKTGTLTEGHPDVVEVVAFSGTADDVLRLAAAVEYGSRHPLAQAILRHTGQKQIDVVEAVELSTQAGQGVSGQLDGQTIVVGSPVYLVEAIAAVAGASVQIEQLQEQGCTVVGVLKGPELVGVIAIRDTLRADAATAVTMLRQLGVTPVMLTGDNRRAAAAIASELGIEYYAELLPEDKVVRVQELQKQSPVAMVGDGINDAPALKCADVGIAMGRGTDVALETADAALTHERIQDLASMIDLSRATLTIVRQNVYFAVGLKVLFLVTSIFGATGLMLAVIADTGATALVTLNSLRLLRKESFMSKKL